MRARQLAAVVAGALALATTGCNGDGEEDAGEQATDLPKPAEQRADARKEAAGLEKKLKKRGAAVADVTLRGKAFQPRKLTVQRGDEVKFVNEDDVAHTVVSTTGRGKQFASGRLEPGGLYVADPEAHGTFDYVCTIHDGMKGRIVVKK